MLCYFLMPASTPQTIRAIVSSSDGTVNATEWCRNGDSALVDQLFALVRRQRSDYSITWEVAELNVQTRAAVAGSSFQGKLPQADLDA